MFETKIDVKRLLYKLYTDCEGNFKIGRVGESLLLGPRVPFDIRKNSTIYYIVKDGKIVNWLTTTKLIFESL